VRGQGHRSLQLALEARSHRLAATSRLQPRAPSLQPRIRRACLTPSPGLPAPLAGPAYPLRQASFQRIAAASRHARCVIIYDRGVLDVAAFLPREQWGGARRLEP
jgi:hypothetical protein